MMMIIIMMMMMIWWWSSATNRAFLRSRSWRSFYISICIAFFTFLMKVSHDFLDFTVKSIWASNFLYMCKKNRSREPVCVRRKYFVRSNVIILIRRNISPHPWLSSSQDHQFLDTIYRIFPNFLKKKCPCVRTSPHLSPRFYNTFTHIFIREPNF